MLEKKKTLTLRGKLFRIDRPLVMGILNYTHNSFYDGGCYNTAEKLIEHTRTMLEEGADMIDIGCVSTKPGSADVSAEEETNKVKQVLGLLVKEFPEVCFSVDTWRASVAEVAVDMGASIINDVSGGLYDEDMLDTVARLHVPYVLMHTQGKPDTMQVNPHYENVTDDVCQQLSKQIRKAQEKGINDIIIDPGFGFGKTLEHNYELLYNLKQFDIFGLPVLIGVSRKSMIYKLFNSTPQDALNGTTVVNTIALLNHADILRVHDVKQAVEAVKIVEMRKIAFS